MVNILIILAVVLGVTIPLIVLKNKIGEKRITIIVKVMAIALFTLAVLRNFLNDNFIWVINGGTYSEIYYKDSDVLQSLLRWGLTFSYIVYPCAVFFKTRTLRNWAVYFCLPIAIISLFCYNDFLTYFTTPSTRAIMTADWVRHLEFSLELILLISIPLLLSFCMGHRFNIKDKKEWGYFFGLLPLALLIVIPVTLPQSLFGFTNMFMVPLSTQHILWIVVIFALLIILYLAFRFRDRETRYMICVFLALFLFYHYNSIYLMDLIASRLPFQLCNLGSYLVLIGLLIRKQGFFNFILVANVSGALIAFCVPDISEGMLSYWNIHFYIEHTWVFVIPLLCVALRIFDRPSLKAIKHYFVGFSIYFVFCALAGIIFNCFLYDPMSSFFNKVNYFYIFDTTVLEVLPFLRFTRNVAVTLGGYTFYPLYMLLIYILYTAFCLAVYYIYNKLCKVGDHFFMLRGVRIGLQEERGRYKRRRVPRKIYED